MNAALSVGSRRFCEGAVAKVSGRVVQLSFSVTALRRRKAAPLIEPGCSVEITFRGSNGRSPIVRGVVVKDDVVGESRLCEVEILDWDTLARYWRSRH